MTADRHSPSRASIIGIAAIVLINVAAAGFMVFALISAGPDAPEQPVSTTVGTPDAPKILAGRESLVKARVRPDGDVVVHQWIRASEPIDQLRLGLPTVPGVSDLAAADVEVTAEGEPADGPTTIARRPVTYSFDSTVNVEVTYRLTGAVELSPSAEGRALAVATTLDVTYAPRAEQETRVIRAPEVLSLACTSSPQASPVPCGEDDGDDQWRAELTGADVGDRVTAALTLG